MPWWIFTSQGIKTNNLPAIKRDKIQLEEWSFQEMQRVAARRQLQISSRTMMIKAGTWKRVRRFLLHYWFHVANVPIHHFRQTRLAVMLSVALSLGLHLSYEINASWYYLSGSHLKQSLEQCDLCQASKQKQMLLERISSLFLKTSLN